MAKTLTEALQDETIVAAKPAYDRDAARIGIVHLGPGAFFRGHQAVYTDEAMGLANTGGLADAKGSESDLTSRDWAICGVSLRSPGVRDGLEAQDGLYTLATLDHDVSYRIIGSLKELLVGPENPQAVIDRLADPDVKIVTMTITEKGYCLAPDGTLDRDNRDIAHDLDHPDTPRSAIGYLVAGLAARHKAGTAPFTCISCDNLPDNGHKLKAAVIGLARDLDAPLADWIEATVMFPRTMVDSITPATDEALIDRVREQAGLEDAWPIQREAFTQWVIEEFDGPRPAWEKAGVTFTHDVAAFEHAKLKLLNGPHSALAYLGPLAGHETVRDAISDPVFERFVLAMTDRETMPGLTAPEGLDLVAYRDAIIERFRNPEIRHLLSQIAWDGTQKLPVRIIATIRENLANGLPVAAHAHVLAGWRLFVIKAIAAGRTITDPRADDLAALGWSPEDSPAEATTSLLSFPALFDKALAMDDTLKTALTQAIAALGAGTPDEIRAALSACDEG